MEVCSTPLTSLTELFQLGALERAAERSVQVLHDEAVRKVIMMDKKQHKPMKKLQFS